MQPIDKTKVQQCIDILNDRDLYIHLEMTTGAYAAHLDRTKHPAATFISNAVIRYSHGSISGNGPYRVGLKTEQGWVYSEGLTHYESESERLILAGHDTAGKLIVSLQLSQEPF
ncbi:YojF family protein [Paenibacillus alba]|uniref:YojF family protein n=1 Tax=Paenibacillus alba TaxID=1197127 RepID=A0ABU6FX78_9BACL|nr:YojF family protein [Paenibacillus alba]MEC0225642.1 YojF family protein [Paenibacillus alba]